MQLAERSAELVGDCPTRREGAGKGDLAPRIRVLEAHGPERNDLGDMIGLPDPGDGRAGQADRLGQFRDRLGTLLAGRLAGLAIPMKRDRSAGRTVGAEPPVVPLDEEVGVEKAPPEQHVLTGEIGVDLVMRAADRDPCIRPDLAALRLARKGRVAFPGTDLAQAGLRQVC